MSTRGRPFRFLAAVGVGWIGMRVLLLWPQTGSLPEAVRALVPKLPAPTSTAEPVAPVIVATPKRRPAPASIRRVAMLPLGPIPAILPVLLPPAAPVPHVPTDSSFRPFTTQLFPRVTPDPTPDRWSTSGWFVARAGSGTGAAPGGQLGGGQAGVRIAYLLAPKQRISAFARITTPLAGRGSEAALGVEWQPWNAPIRLAIERRIGLDGTPGGTGAGIIAGLYRESNGFRIEGYGQAGLIARHRTEPYADGAIRVTRRITPKLSLGAGAWGGAQRDAQRLDSGPSATLTVGPARLSLDWRQRIAGRASPGSGLALTLGGDF